MNTDTRLERLARSFRTVTQEAGIRTGIEAAGGYASRRIRSALLQRSGAYFALNRHWHRYRRRFDVDGYDVSIRPFQVHWIDPADIVRISPRKWPKEYEFGAVESGGWDVRDGFEFGDDYERAEWKKRDFGSLRFEETMFFRSLRDRFENDTPWRETVYYQEAVRALENGHMIHDWITSERELMADLEDTDDLYHAIERDGYRTQRDLLRSGESEAVNYVDHARNELRLDVSRDGDPLFTGGGKHRLSIAKILDVDSIPVVVMTRHERWMEKLEDGAEKQFVAP